jgi:uncharacterized damage-inducible protein DinB
MSNAAFCLARRQKERAAFVKVLKAVPQDGMHFRPEPKARTAADLAWLIASEEAGLVELLDTGVIDWKEQPAPATVEQIVAFYEKHAREVDERMAKLDDAGWNKPGKFMFGGSPVWEDTVGELVWGHLLDAIHHRGQLSTYLRPMGSKVPSIYGPSGDDAGQ